MGPSIATSAMHTYDCLTLALQFHSSRSQQRPPHYYGMQKPYTEKQPASHKNSNETLPTTAKFQFTANFGQLSSARSTRTGRLHRT